MIVTVHLTDHRKITKDFEKLLFFNSNDDASIPAVCEDCITVNLRNVVDIRPAEPDEIAHAEIHGY